MPKIPLLSCLLRIAKNNQNTTTRDPYIYIRDDQNTPSTESYIHFWDVQNTTTTFFLDLVPNMFKKQYFNICKVYHESWHTLNIIINIEGKHTKVYIFKYMLNMPNKGNMYMYNIYNICYIRIYAYYIIPTSVLGILSIFHKDANIYIEGCAY